MVKKLLTGLLVFFFSVTLASAAEVGGVAIPDTLTVGEESLVFNGAGIRKKFGFKIYIGSLYLKAKTSDAQQIIDADETMAITMTWKRTGPIDKVNPVYAEGLAYTDYDSKQQDVDAFLATTVKAKKGDIWQYIYQPGKGTDIIFNGEVVKNIPGLDFKKALFSIWLFSGESFTGDTLLRKGMLGQ